MKEYIYGLFIDDLQIDQTAIDEKDEDLAMELFKEFAPHEGYTVSVANYVELLEENEVDE